MKAELLNQLLPGNYAKECGVNAGMRRGLAAH
jgi:hypothetical protein